MPLHRLRRGRAPAVTPRLVPGTALLITDLHRDFLSGGPLHTPASDSAAEKLIGLYNSLQPAIRSGDRERPYRYANVVVEGSFWGRPDRHRLAPGWPEHGQGAGIRGLPDGLDLMPSDCHTWTFCPAAGDEDLLATQAEGKGQSFSLETVLAEEYSPAGIHLAGLGVEHSGLALARTLSQRLGPRGTVVAFRADLSSFLRPDQADRHLELLESAGVGVTGAPPRG